jgi:hypothetical protein
MNALSHHDINVSIDCSEPRIQDLRLTEALSFERPRKIHEIINRNIKKLERFGSLSYNTTNSGIKGGRPGREYWPNEKNARLTFSRQSRSLNLHVEKGRAGIGTLSDTWRSLTAPAKWLRGFSMVGRFGPRKRTVPRSGSSNPIRLTTRNWNFCGRVLKLIAWRAAL